jgi:hypothetical protein
MKRATGSVSRNKIFLEENKQILSDAYLIDKLTLLEIAEKYKIAKSVLWRYLKNNIELRDSSHSKQIYEINENIFEKIDTHEKAYWLGLLYADGSHILSDGKHEFTISLNYKDGYLIEEFKKFMGYGGVVKYLDNLKFKNHQPMYRIVNSNKKISEDLLKLGMMQNKTKYGDFPYFLDEQFYPSFILGYFDGDGCITKSMIGNHSKFTFSIVGTTKFIEEVQNKIFINFLGLNKTKLTRIINNITGTDISIMNYHGNKQAIKIRDWLYQDYVNGNITICMIRKKDKFDSIEQMNINNKENYLKRVRNIM